MSQVQLKEQIIRNPGKAKIKACSMTIGLLSIIPVREKEAVFQRGVNRRN